MVALRAPKLYRRGRSGLEGCAAVGAGWLRCASPSDMLTLGRSSCEAVCPCSEPNRGGVEVLMSVAPPAIEVSGTPQLRGGGSDGVSVDGWYALAVCRSRLEDCLYGW
jgi:hypothetical protein